MMETTEWMDAVGLGLEPDTQKNERVRKVGEIALLRLSNKLAFWNRSQPHLQCDFGHFVHF